MNLLISDFYRFVKDRIFYVMLSILAAIIIIMCIVMSQISSSGSSELMLIFLRVDVFGAIAGIPLALFLGKDYENNTIRNKICCGEGRYKIYFVKLIESLIIASLFFWFTMLCFIIFGMGLSGFMVMDEFWQKIAGEWVLLLGFTAIINCLCVTTKSTKVTIIFTIVQLVVLNVFGQFLLYGEVLANKTLCRSLYFTVSELLRYSREGLYTVDRYIDGEMTTIEYGGLYLNAIIVALSYIALTIGISLLVIRKQEYK